MKKEEEDYCLSMLGAQDYRVACHTLKKNLSGNNCDTLAEFAVL